LIGVVQVGDFGWQFLDDIMIGVREVFKETFRLDGKGRKVVCRPIIPRPLTIPPTAYKEEVGKYNIEPFFTSGIKEKYKADLKLKQSGRKISKTLVITNVPLFSFVNNCGVFGEAENTGEVAVISIFHLEKDATEQSIRDRTIKECVHELGHTLGLHHCMHDKCVMKQSIDIYDVDAKTRFFCDDCNRRLMSIQFSKDYRSWKGP